MRRWLGLAAVVLAAMALGRVITDRVTLDDAGSAPFVRHGVVGRPVHLAYADVTVDHVRTARYLNGTAITRAGGVFVLVDATLVARHEPTSFLGADLYDDRGRRFAPDTRASTCATATNAPTGAHWHVLWCFDVPKDALAGMHVRIARGGYGVDGSDQRRDDLADVDLGLSRARARSMAATTDFVRGQQPGFAPIDTSLLDLPEGVQ